MNYNNINKTIIKVVQINSNELEKCKSGKGFKINLITNSRRIIVDPPRTPKSPRKSLDERITEAVAKALVPVIIRLDRIEATLAEHGKILKQHGEILKRHDEILKRHDEIFKHNNLR
jgi:hypothetical protein